MPAAKTPERWRRHPTVRFFALALAVLAVYHGYLYLAGPSRMTDRLRARLTEGPSTVDVLVTAKFPPEEFHILLLQQVCIMRGVQDSTAKLYVVTTEHGRCVYILDLFQRSVTAHNVTVHM